MKRLSRLIHVIDSLKMYTRNESNSGAILNNVTPGIILALNATKFNGLFMIVLF